MENYIVVKELKQKRGSNNDYSAPVKFSTEQRFIPAMLNSNNNNLEEQNILGTDCVTIDWEEDNEKKTVKKYYDGSGSLYGYYILSKTTYMIPVSETGIYFDEDSFVTTSRAACEFSEDSLKLNDKDTFYFDDTDESLNIDLKYSVTNQDELYFRDDPLNESDEIQAGDKFISRKICFKRVKDNKTYLKEIILKEN